MNNISINTQKRVFHIDRECYIIYLGTDPYDYKPFLRIGNSKNIPDEIVKNTYYIVITDSLTGNPLLEPENINQDEPGSFRYVGDKKNLKDFFNFLNCFNIKTDGYPISENIGSENNGAVLYFYDDGNLELHLNKKVIFNLKKREKEDQHFTEFARTIKDNLVRDPLFQKSNLLKEQKIGFILIDKDIGLLLDGKLYFRNLPDNYFEKVSRIKLDPDIIDGVFINRANESLVNLLKRKIYINRNLDIYITTTTTDTDKRNITCTVNLFNNKKNLFRLKDLKSGVKGIGNTKINCTENIIEVYHGNNTKLLINSKPYSSIKNDLITDGYFISEGSNGLNYIISSNRVKIPVLNNIPYFFDTTNKLNQESINRYIEELIAILTDNLSDQENVIINSLFSMYKNIENRKFLNKLLQKNKKMVKKLSGKIEPYIITSTIINSMISVLQEKNENTEIVKKLEKLKSKITTNLLRNKDNTTNFKYLPVFGILYTNNTKDKKSFLLYRPITESLSKADYEISRETSEEITGYARGNKALFEKELDELEMLLKKIKITSVKKPVKIAIEDTDRAVTPKAEDKIKKNNIRKDKSSEMLKEETENTLTLKKDINTTESGKAVVKKIERKSKKRVNLLYLILPLIIVIALAVIYIPKITTTKTIKTEISQSKGYIKTEENQQTSTIKQLPKETKTPEKEEKNLVKLKENLNNKNIKSPDRKNTVNINNKREFDEFLNLGYIKLTILDIYKLTNRIASDNGYRKLNEPEELGKDPDWIYPGNIFKLPDGSKYTVKKGDTIWYIAKNFIKKQLDRDWPVFKKIEKQIKRDKLELKERKKIINILKKLRANSYSENFTKAINKTIEKLEK